MRFTDRSLLDDYLKITKAVLIPSLKSQINQNFKWIVIINPDDEFYLKKELDYPFKPVYGSLDLKDCISKNPAEIQTRHDCDDWMSPEYVQKIQSTYLENIEKNKSLIIHAQPRLLIYQTGTESKFREYNDYRCSPFASLCQKEFIHCVFDRKHRLLKELANHVIKLDEGYVKRVIHGKNISIIGRPHSNNSLIEPPS